MAQPSAFDSMHPAGKLPPTLTPTGHFAGKPTLPISRSVTLIGARKQARLQLISSTVSQNHALIVNADSGPYVRDLASREHVFVNGIQVREGQLADADEIQIGRFTFRFNESPTTQPIEAIRNIPNAPVGSLEIDGADSPVPIEGKSVLIGRRETCDIALLEDSASTTHAIIFEMDGHRYIRDLASRTGTFVNGRQVHQTELSPGDAIRIGQTTMRYQADSLPARDLLPRQTAVELAPADDLVPIEDEPRPAPTPKPRAVPPPPLPAPAGTEALELVQDQPAETEEVELTPADLEAGPIEVEQDLLTPVEAEERVEDADLAPLDIAGDEPLPLEPSAPVASTSQLNPNESADLTDLLPDSQQSAEEAEIDLEPLEVPEEASVEVADEQAAEPVEIEVEPEADDVSEPVELAPRDTSPVALEPEAEPVEAVAEEEEQPVPATQAAEAQQEISPELPAASESEIEVGHAPAPVPVDADLAIDQEVTTVELEADREEPVDSARPQSPEAAPVSSVEPESVDVAISAEAIDELLLLTPSTAPAQPPVPSKFAPGASQLNLEPVTDVQAPHQPDALELEPVARVPQPLIQPAPAKPIEAKLKDDLFLAPPRETPPPRPQPVAPTAPPPARAPQEVTPAEVEPLAFDMSDVQGLDFAQGDTLTTSDEVPIDQTPLPELEMSAEGDDLSFETPDLATSLDFTPLDVESVVPEPLDSLERVEVDVPTLDLGGEEIEAIPGLTEAEALSAEQSVSFDLDGVAEPGQPLADTIVGVEPPVAKPPPSPAKGKRAAPAKKAGGRRKKKSEAAPAAEEVPPAAPALAPRAPAAEGLSVVEEAPSAAPALDLSFPPVAAPLTPSAAEVELAQSAPLAEVLPPVDATPESAFPLAEAVPAIADSPPGGEPQSVELTDSTFGRAVESFVGESTGPIVEETPAFEPESMPQVDVEAPPSAELELSPTAQDESPTPILPVTDRTPIEVEPAKSDKLFDLQAVPGAEREIEPEVEIELEPVAEVSAPPAEPEVVELDSTSSQPDESVAESQDEPAVASAESAEAELSEIALEPVDVELIEPSAPDTAVTVPQTPAPDQATAPGKPDDVAEEWGLDIESESPEPAPAAPVQPVAKAPSSPPTPPVASATSASFLWGADQDHFLGGRPLSLGGAAPPTPRPRPTPPPVPERGPRAQPITPATPLPEVPSAPRSAPRPPRAKPGQVGTAFDGLALPVREADVFGNFNPGLTGGLGAGMAEDIFGRRGPTSIPATGAGSGDGGATGPKRPLPRRARSEAGAEAWSPPPVNEPAPPAPRDAQAAPVQTPEAEPEPPAPLEPPPRKKRRWFGLRSLLFLMLLCMSVAGLVIYYTPVVPNHSSVTGEMAFANYDKVPRIDLTRLEGEQKQKLNELRPAARSKLLATNSNQAPRSFLDDQVSYLRTVSMAQMDLERGVMSLRRQSATPGDQQAMSALLQAWYDSNSGLVGESGELVRTVESLSRGRGESEARIAALKLEIDRLGVVAQSAPDATERAKLEAQAAQLESDVKATQIAAARIAESLKQLQQDASTTGRAEEPGSDAVLVRLEEQMVELNTRIRAIQEGRSEKSQAAREKLDASLVAFNRQIEQAQGAVKDNPELLAYVNNAKNLLANSRELTDQLIKRQQEQYTRLSELKTGLNDKMLARRAEVWKKDPELLKLLDKKDIMSRRLNVAGEQGLTKEADEIRAELNLVESMIQARQTVVADDGFYADAIDQIQKIIEATQRGLEDDRTLTMQKLDEMQAAFAKAQPPLDNLTPEQKQLAEEMEKRLGELALARRQYAASSDEVNRQADEEMRSLQASASELSSKVQARRQELGAASGSPAPLAGGPSPSPEQRRLAIEQKTAELAAAEKMRADAEAASGAVNKKLLELKSRAQQAAQAGQERDQKIRQRDREQQELDQLNNQYEMKQKLAQQTVYPLALTAASVRFDRKDDLRPYALLGAAALIVAFFVAVILFTDIRGGATVDDSSEVVAGDPFDEALGQEPTPRSRRSNRQAPLEV